MAQGYKAATKAEQDKFNPLAIATAYDNGVKARAAFDREAERNLSILMGDHYLVHHAESGRIFRKLTGDGSPKLAIPLIKPLWRMEAANLGKNLPIPEVIPTTNQEDDRAKAEFGQRALDSELNRLDFHDMYDRLAVWSSSTGCAYIHSAWDPDKKQIVQEVVPHTEMVVPEYVRNSMDEARWCIRAQVMSPDDVFETFGKDVSPNAVPMGHFLDSVQSVRYTGIISNIPASGVLVLQYWCLPSERHPKGALVTLINGELCMPETFDEYPYKMDSLPFVDFHHIRLPGRFAGQSMIRDLWSSQQDYNHSRTKMAMARALISSPKVFYAEGTIQGMDRLGPIDGEMIPVNTHAAPMMPQAMQMPPIPGHIYAASDMALREMADISHVHDISRGIAPGRTPASAVMALQAADTTVIGAVARHMERRVAKVGKQILELAQQNWTKERSVRIWSEAEGSAGGYAYYTLKNTDFAGQTDVRCVSGSALPKSKDALRETIENYWNLGLIQDPNIVLKHADIPGVKSILAAENIDVTHADDELAIWASLSQKASIDDLSEDDINMMPLAEPWHANAVHIERHNNLRKEATFRGWPDWLREEVAAHIRAHEQFIEDERVEAISEAQMMQGAGPAPMNGAAQMDLPAMGGEGLDEPTGEDAMLDTLGETSPLF